MNCLEKSVLSLTNTDMQIILFCSVLNSISIFSCRNPVPLSPPYYFFRQFGYWPGGTPEEMVDDDSWPWPLEVMPATSMV